MSYHHVVHGPTGLPAYGLFINNIVEFAVIAFSIFLAVRQINRMRGTHLR